MSIATSEAVLLLETFSPQFYSLIAGATLICFEHIITFGQEVQLFWGERSFSAWLFFANRMLALVYAIISVWSLMKFYTVTSCMANYITNSLVLKLIGIISQVVTILRVYAVTGGDRRPVLLLALSTVINMVINVYVGYIQVSYSVVALGRTAICVELYTSDSAQDIAKKLSVVNAVCGIIAVITTLAILWCKLYVHHRSITVALLSTRNPSLAALLLRDSTIQLTAILLPNLLHTVLDLLGLSTVTFIIEDLEYSLTSVLISRILLNVRAAARSTRGEQSQTPSFVRSQRGLQTEVDVENMSFELNVPGSTEQAPDRSHVQDSIEHDQIIAEPRSNANSVVTAGDSHQYVNEEERMDGVEEEMQSDWEYEEYGGRMGVRAVLSDSR